MATSPHLQLFHRKAGAKVRFFFEIHKKKCKKNEKNIKNRTKYVISRAPTRKRPTSKRTRTFIQIRNFEGTDTQAFHLETNKNFHSNT